MQAIILLGGPGAGKGTLAGLLSRDAQAVHISTGDMLRAAVREETPVGLEAKSFMDAGHLVPDQIILKLIEELILRTVKPGRFLFDGFPRTIIQAEGLDRLFRDHGGTVTHVFNMGVSREVLIQRLSGRRVCKSCGEVYHLTNMPPQKEGLCDLDGGELYQRADDSEATILNRLEVYERQTAPLIAYYRQQELLHDIDAGGAPETTNQLVLSVLNG